MPDGHNIYAYLQSTKYFNHIEKEVREKLKRGLSKEERASMYKTFESMSGQVTFYQSQIL